MKYYHYVISGIRLIFLCILFNACYDEYDPELMQPDGYGGGYNLTKLGCLVNGPWEVSEFANGYNTRLFLNDSEISSKPSPYTEMQKDLVFELHKGGTITYWLKSQIGPTTDTTVRNGTTTIIQNPPKATS